VNAKFFSFFILAISLALISQPANAGSFPITGTSALDGNDVQDFVTGGPLSLLTQAPSGPLIVAIYSSPGVVNFSLSIGMVSTLQGGFGLVTYGSQSTDLVTGALIFSGTFTLPTLPEGTDFSITFPVTMIGNGIAYQDLSGPGVNPPVKGPQIFDLAFKGSGTATVQGCFCNGQYFVGGVSASFNGAATVVPEPSSVLLLGTGLAGMVGMRRKLWARFAR
jgi:hypothetical protein